MADPTTDERDSTYRRAKRRVDSTRVVITDRAVDLEGRVPAIQAAVRAWEHDRAVGGEIMAGAIAFRAFVFLLPYVLVLVTLLGFASRVESPEEVVKQVGITGLAAQSVAESARASNGSLWIALIIGLVALYSTSKALARVLRIAHALAWGKPVARLKRSWRAGLLVVGVALGLSVVVALVSKISLSHHVAGLLIVLLAVFIYGGVWFGLSLVLPHGDAPWTALLPGAVFVGFGVQILHLITIYYVSRKVGTSSRLYGPLGGTVAILGWTYLVGRLAVSSAVLNASLYRQRESQKLGDVSAELPD